MITWLPIYLLATLCSCKHQVFFIDFYPTLRCLSYILSETEDILSSRRGLCHLERAFTGCATTARAIPDFVAWTESRRLVNSFKLGWNQLGII